MVKTPDFGVKRQIRRLFWPPRVHGLAQYWWLRKFCCILTSGIAYYCILASRVWGVCSEILLLRLAEYYYGILVTILHYLQTSIVQALSTSKKHYFATFSGYDPFLMIWVDMEAWSWFDKGFTWKSPLLCPVCSLQKLVEESSKGQIRNLPTACLSCDLNARLKQSLRHSPLQEEYRQHIQALNHTPNTTALYHLAVKETTLSAWIEHKVPQQCSNTHLCRLVRRTNTEAGKEEMNSRQLNYCFSKVSHSMPLLNGKNTATPV